MPEFSNFQEFLTCVREAQFTFSGLRDWIVSLFVAVRQTDVIAGCIDQVLSYIASVQWLVPWVLIALSAVLCLFGKRLMALVRFLGCFVLAFVAGVYYLAPLLPEAVEIPSWVIGLVVGVVAAVLSKFLYYALVAVGCGYGMYILCYRGELLPFLTQYNKGNMVACIVAMAVTLILLFVLFRFVEMAATAAVGSALILLTVSRMLFNYFEVPFIAANPVVWNGVFLAVLALLGFAVQVRTRKRY